MAGLFKKVQCIHCQTETRIPWLRGWVYVDKYDFWYCQEQCVLKHGEIRHKEHLEMTLLLIQQTMKLSNEQVEKLKLLAEQSGALIDSAKHDSDAIIANLKQPTPKEIHRHDNSH